MCNWSSTHDENSKISSLYNNFVQDLEWYKISYNMVIFKK
jgi:hypothetical protein